MKRTITRLDTDGNIVDTITEMEKAIVKAGCLPYKRTTWQGQKIEGRLHISAMQQPALSHDYTEHEARLNETASSCQDEPIPGYVEETWVANGYCNKLTWEPTPSWREDLAGIHNAEARLRASITRNERWPFCPTCQQNRHLAYEHEESETDHRLITKVTAYWTCTEEGEDDE